MQHNGPKARHYQAAITRVVELTLHVYDPDGSASWHGILIQNLVHVILHRQSCSAPQLTLQKPDAGNAAETPRHL